MKEGRKRERKGENRGLVLKSAFLEGLFALNPLGLEVPEVQELRAHDELEGHWEVRQNC